jgi:hypothetical protein
MIWFELFGALHGGGPGNDSTPKKSLETYKVAQPLLFINNKSRNLKSRNLT